MEISVTNQVQPLPKKNTPPRGGVLNIVGNTPLVRLDRILQPRDWSLYAKLDALNPAGSTKDRAALRSVEDALNNGVLHKSSTVVESSSGNMGVGLAQACSYYGLRFICVVDPFTTQQNIRLMQTYGAEVEVVQEPDPVTHSYLASRIRRVNEIVDTLPDAFWINQYHNQSCVKAHRDTTAPEIVEQLGFFPDYFFCAVGTCATIQGCALYFSASNPETQVVGVDVIGSVILGGDPGPRKIPGMGSAQRSPLLTRSLIDVAVKIREEDAMRWCRTLARTEALLVGGSSGAVIAAVEQLADQIPEDATVAVLMPDRGERYLDLIFNDAALL